MLGLSSAVRVFLCREPADMRKSFDGLCALVVGALHESPTPTTPITPITPITSGHLFIFRNRRGDRLKALWFEQGGLAIFYKRLEKGVFHFPSLSRDVAAGDGAGSDGTPGARVEVSARELAMILSGLEQKNLKQHARFACNAIRDRVSSTHTR